MEACEKAQAAFGRSGNALSFWVGKSVHKNVFRYRNSQYLLRVDLKMKFNDVLSEWEDWWHASNALPCQAVSHRGKTVAEALENIKEVIEIDLEPEDSIKKVIL